MNEIEQINYKTKNTKLISDLKKLKWNIESNLYYTKLPEGKSLSDNFYKSIQFMNTLTIIGYKIYNSLPDNCEDKEFLEYFIANSFESEEFIWNQRGIMQCYYHEGLEWQRGSIINKELTNESIIPILSSSVLDSIIAIILKYIKDPHIIFWLGQEQQNFFSMKLLTKDWCIPVNTISNPFVFKNIDDICDINPHRLVFGPSTWLAMTKDIITWIQTNDKSKFVLYINQGKEIWKLVEENIYINEKLLQKIPIKITLNNIFTSSIHKIVNIHLISIINNNKNVNIFMNYIKNNIIYNYNKKIHKLSIIKADGILLNVTKSLLCAIYSYNELNYKYHLKMVCKHIQHFYCGHCCNECVFIDPKVICA